MSKFDLISWSPFLRRLVYNLICLRNAHCQRRMFWQDLENLKSLKGRHKGQRCFVIGTGPSLTTTDLESLSGEVTFGTNRIYELLDKTTWRPTYYMCQDHDIIRKFGSKIESIDAQMLFVPVEYKERFSGTNCRYFVLQEREFYPHDASFSRNVAHSISQGYTVTYGAIQLAVYMGFSEIYLIGVDHNYSVTRDHSGRPIKQNESTQNNYSQGMVEYVNMNNLPRVEESTIAYETAEKVSRRLGVRIYNATRGGKLEAFERVSLEQLMQKQ